MAAAAKPAAGMIKDMSEGVVHAVGRPVSDAASPFAPLETQNDVALTASTTAAKANMNAPTVRTLEATEDLQTALNNASGIVLVDFYADWCGPCRRQGKILHELEAKAKSMGAQIIKVDVDKHTKIAEQYEVGSLPTLIAFRNGTVVHRKLGLTDEDQILTILNK
jgi:thioredoxin